MTSRKQELSLLETILRELDAALVVADREGAIRFCNPAARSLFGHHRELAPGGSLYALCQRGPIAHALRFLAQREEPETGVVCATRDDTLLLHCRIRPLPPSGAAEPLLLFTFTDLTRQLAEQDRVGGLPPALLAELRHPLSNLAAAAANLQAHPEMDPENRAAFTEIIFRESSALTDRFDALAREEQATSRQPWPLAEVNSADLLDCLLQRLNGPAETAVTMSGAPLWLRADFYALLLALETLVLFVRKITGGTKIDLEARLGDRRVYLDLVWPGAPISQPALDRVRHTPLPEGGGGVTVAEVLAHHDSDLWSQRHQRPGFALLRMPLPHSPRQWQATAPPTTTLAARPLAALPYVVFDTETVGLHPTGSDEILALAAVRIDPGGSLGNAGFARLIKPRHPLPAEAMALLAISGEMVAGAAPLAEVLPQFRAFVGAAVLVGHNASFDLNFFRSQLGEGGFANPLLDTLLLARLVEPQRSDLTLAGLAEWLGVEAPEEQTTLAGCQLTAGIFLRLLERLAEMGLTTLGEVLAASAHLVARQAAAADAGRRDA